jgi:hypothetical protein
MLCVNSTTPPLLVPSSNLPGWLGRSASSRLRTCLRLSVYLPSQNLHASLEPTTPCLHHAFCAIVAYVGARGDLSRVPPSELRREGEEEKRSAQPVQALEKQSKLK